MNEQPADIQPVEEALLQAVLQPVGPPEPLSTRLKRRGLFATAAVVLAALVTRSVDQPGRAEAGVDGDVVLGAVNSTSLATTIQSSLAGSGNSVLLIVDGRTATTTGSVFAVEGWARGERGVGVSGFGGTGNLGFGFGVEAQGGNSSGTSAASPGTYSVGGQAMGSGAGGPGVVGISGASTFGPHGFGVQGIGSKNATGVNGVSNASLDLLQDGDGSGIGVHGKSGSGTGVVGESQSLFGVYGQSYGAGAGVEGIANATGAIGVQGQSGSGTGIQGQSGQGCGIRGLSNSFVGLIGISDTSIGLYGYNVSPNVPALYAENLGPNNRIAGLFNGDVQVHGNFSVSGGAKAAAVTMPDGTTAMMYSQESPEAYFEDFGEAQLVNGAARVQLEAEFASLIHRERYLVYITPGGDSRGLYVTNRDASGFNVRESQGGTSSLPFSYRIVSRRNDIPGTRLARISNQAIANAAQVRAAAVGSGAGGPGSSGPTPFAPLPGSPPTGSVPSGQAAPGPTSSVPLSSGPGGR